MAKLMRVGVKAAWIGGICLIASAVVTAIIQNLKKNSNTSLNQNVEVQKIDSGSINTYTAGSDVKIENNAYNGIVPIDTQRKKKEENKPIIKEKALLKNQIINNAPNQGVQINENNGTVVVGKPVPLPRKFTINEAKMILKDYPVTYPIEIWLKGTTTESKNFFNQVISAFQEMGYANISKNIIGMYVNIEEDIEIDFKYKVENDKLVFSIYPQQ